MNTDVPLDTMAVQQMEHQDAVGAPVLVRRRPVQLL